MRTSAIDTDETRKLIQRMFLKPGDDCDDSAQLHCPFCEDEYVHMQKPLYFSGGDYEAARAFGLGVRGDVTAISFWGECGHSWVLAFGFHKGQIFYDVILKEASSEP